MKEETNYKSRDKIMKKAKPLHKHLYKNLHKKDMTGDVNEAKNGRCPAGQYYCYTDEKCKSIPRGFMVDPKGMLRKENGHSIDDDKKKNGNGNGNGNGAAVSEGNKSGDSSLRDWFGKSRSSDGKPGWVQLGGKYAGKPCAKQPGQTTKPKCGSSKMKRALSKDEEEAAFRRKNRKDPNPDRKGKAINVKTEETIREGDYWHPDPKKDAQISGQGNKARAREDRGGSSPSPSSSKPDPKKLRKGESYMDYAKRQKGGSSTPKPKERKRDKIGKLLGKAIDKVGGIKSEETILEKAGTKDACYHKVKSRYKVWPSAYASGALVKCRKKGAANWGNSTKKEEFQMSDWRSEIDLEEGQKCWKGYEKKGTKKMFGKTYNNCVKKEELGLISKTPLDEKKGCMHNHKGEECPVHGKKECPSEVSEAVRVPAQTGNIINAYFKYRTNYISLKMFFPQTSKPSKGDVQDAIEKVYPGARLLSFQVSDYQPGEPLLHTEDWQKKSGKDPEGGLNEKGRKSYERQNPGSDLKRPSKKVGNPRRASFCARMKGMKKKLTSSKTANDPDSRINKSLRAWNC